MLKLTDVSRDPTAPSRSRLRAEDIEAARTLGFLHEGWVSAVTDGPRSGSPDDDEVLIDLVMVHRDGACILEMARWRWLEDVAVRTLFEDGTVIVTSRMPSEGWWKLRWGVASAPEHGYFLEHVETKSVAHLVAVHEERVRRRRVRGQRPVEKHDMRAYLAMRKRWREIADPRMGRQQKIASRIALATIAMTAITGMALTRTAVAELGSSFPAVGLVAAGASLVAGLALGFSAFVFSMYFVAAILAQRGDAPARRKARGLLALADSVPSGYLPAPAAPRPKRPSRTSRELARLRRIDLAVAVASTLVLPLSGFVGTLLFGTAAIPVVLGLVFTMDGAIALFTKKTRTQLLRERCVPALVRAEGETTCDTAPCATPLGKKVLGVTWMLGGLARLYSARAALHAGSTAAPTGSSTSGSRSSSCRRSLLSRP